MISLKLKANLFYQDCVSVVLSDLIDSDRTTNLALIQLLLYNDKCLKVFDTTFIYMSPTYYKSVRRETNKQTNKQTEISYKTVLTLAEDGQFMYSPINNSELIEKIGFQS